MPIRTRDYSRRLMQAALRPRRCCRIGGARRSRSPNGCPQLRSTAARALPRGSARCRCGCASPKRGADVPTVALGGSRSQEVAPPWWSGSPPPHSSSRRQVALRRATHRPTTSACGRSHGFHRTPTPADTAVRRTAVDPAPARLHSVRAEKSRPHGFSSSSALRHPLTAPPARSPPARSRCRPTRAAGRAPRGCRRGCCRCRASARRRRDR